MVGFMAILVTKCSMAMVCSSTKYLISSLIVTKIKIKCRLVEMVDFTKVNFKIIVSMATDSSILLAISISVNS